MARVADMEDWHLVISEVGEDIARGPGRALVDDHDLAGPTVSVEQYLDEHRPKNFYVKHHPHEKMPPALVDSLKSMGARPTETNTYDLLSVEGLRICALSSSVCHEAAYFGCRPTSFFPTREFPLVGEQATVVRMAQRHQAEEGQGLGR